MNKTTTIKMGVSLSILAFSLAVSTASAQTCGSQPTCADLGFIYNAKTCPVTPGKSLKCPFDPGAYWCPDPVDTEPETCPTGSLRPDQIPAWSKIFGVYNVSLAPTWCKKNTGIPDAFAEALTNCPKIDNGFGEQDIFSTTARAQGLLGSGTWDLNSGTTVLIIGGTYCYQELTSADYFTFAKNNGFPLVVISNDSSECSTNNSTFKGKFMGVGAGGGTDADVDVTNKDLHYGGGIMIVVEKGQAKATKIIDCSNPPTGSSFGGIMGRFE